jgi:hypothetical protein
MDSLMEIRSGKEQNKIEIYYTQIEFDEIKVEIKLFLDILFY